MSKDYEKIYRQVKEYEARMHEKNQRKIRMGFKVNIIIPLVFLFLCFIIPGTKFLFLMLWIISLFGIAFYLLYVEYTDYKALNKMKEFGVIDEDIDRNLMGDEIDQAILETRDDIESRINTLGKELERLKHQRAIFNKDDGETDNSSGHETKGEDS